MCLHLFYFIFIFIFFVACVFWQNNEQNRSTVQNKKKIRRSSKFRHVFGEAAKPEGQYAIHKPPLASGEGQYVKANAKYFAYALPSYNNKHFFFNFCIFCAFICFTFDFSIFRILCQAPFFLIGKKVRAL